MQNITQLRNPETQHLVVSEVTRAAVCKNLVVLYHGNCNDGLGAATVVYSFIKSVCKDCVSAVEFKEGFYQSKRTDEYLETLKEKTVLILDFSIPKQSIQLLLEKNCKVYVIDHHISAFRDLADVQLDGFEFIYDSERSGAGLTREIFPLEGHGWVDYIEDRDLWRFKYPGTRDFHEFLLTLQRSPQFWHYYFQGKSSFEAEINVGSILLGYKRKLIDSIVRSSSKMRCIGGINVVVINCPGALASDALEVLYTKHQDVDFVASYYDTDKYRSFSLRTNTDFDVSVLAKIFGGGGHAKAAAFHVDLNHELARI
jgi:oligoribonuclease NrnB/cAMP/cGMP phosphodiesterase (DHH superfamily)